MKQLLTAIVKELVDMPDRVKVVEVRTATINIFEIDVDVTDRGKVIGKKGSIIEALRTIVYCINKKYGHKAEVNLLVPESENIDGKIGR